MMITEVMKISEPPYTNRGVTRQKEDLTALIDWCQITVKGVDVFIIIEDILRIPLSFVLKETQWKLHPFDSRQVLL